jgi:uncharacterized membrane protein (DUF485 family)
MALELVDFLQGSFSLIFVIISIIIGLSILSKYQEFKSRIYIFVGLSWIGLANPWIPDSINFIMLLFSNESLRPSLYFIIGNVFLPFFFLCWLMAFSELLYKEKQLLIVGSFFILSVLFEIIFFILLFTNIDAIGILRGPFLVEFGLLITIYLIVFVIVLLVTGVLFARRSLRSENEEVKLKGKLLLAAFLSFSIGAILDSMIGGILENGDPLLPILVVVVRIILISSAIEFYGGFILPKWLKNLFLR